MGSPAIYHFDGIQVDVAAMRVCRGPDELALEPKTFRLLQFLIENRDRVLTKEEIFKAVWQETAVGDNALTRAVAQIRKTLDDDPRNPRYIDTVPTVGYRFIGVLSEPTSARPIPAPTPRRLRWLPWAALATAIVLVVVAAVLFRPKPHEPALAPMSRAIPLTTDPGNQDNPSFSPNGDQVAYQWDGVKQDNADIYVKGLSSDAVPLRLTTDPAPDLFPSWSPDGKTIAFMRLVSNDKMELMLVPALGGPERRLAELPIWIDDYALRPAWSNDSKWLITQAALGTSAALYRVSVETGEATPILKTPGSMGDASPELSPDGTLLTFIRHPPFNAGQLWSVHVDANLNAIDSPRQINSGTRLSGFARFTSDGTHLVVHAQFGAVRIPITGTDDPEQLPMLGGYPHSFDVSRRGNRLIFTTVRGDANIWRIDLTTKVPHPEQIVASTMRDVYPQYSPDGRRMSFFSNRSGVPQIWIGDADGKNLRQLTSMQRGTTDSAHWSPDGQTITFDSNTTGPYQIYAISTDGTGEKQLTLGAYGSFGATWSHDGKWLYYTSRATGRNELWKMPAGGGTAVQITHTGSMLGVEAPDGKTIYYCKESGEGSIWKIPADGGPEVHIVDSLYRSNFFVVKDGIYYMTAPKADYTSDLMFYSFTTEHSHFIWHMGSSEYGLTVSPDGRYLTYSQFDNSGSNLMLIENFH